MEKKAKPWRLEYQWKSPQDFEKHSVRANKDPYTTKWFMGYNRYENIEKARKGLHREFIEPYFDAVVGGRNWRLRNVVTGDIMTITIENKEIILT